MIRIAGSLFATLMLALSSAPGGTTFDYSVAPTQEDNFLKAGFRLWLPDQYRPLRGVIVLIPGWNAPGLQLSQDRDWRNLAQKWEMGLLACQWEGSMSGAIYDQAQKGSGTALLKAIEGLALQTGRKELREVPLAFCGFSSGGQFSYHFGCWKPGRTLGWVAIKGAFYETSPTDQVRAIPGLWIAGENDEAFRIEYITKLVTTERENGALWAMAVEPRSGHEIGHSFSLAKVFLEDVFRLRLSNANPGAPLAAVRVDQGWIGIAYDHTVKPANQSPRSTRSFWLPGETSARAWSEFQAQPATGE